MGLFGLFGKQKQKAKQHTVVKPQADLEHLTKDGDLPWGWIYANRDFTERIGNEYRHFSDGLREARKKGVLAEYAALKSLVIYMDNVRKLCDSKGECFSEWASIGVAHPATHKEYKERLVYMEANMDELLKQEQLTKNLREDVLKIVAENPGILQTNVYKLFPAEIKNEVSYELYLLSGEKKISREKQGRTYSLTIAK